jgi:hypothetical protein
MGLGNRTKQGFVDHSGEARPEEKLDGESQAPVISVDDAHGALKKLSFGDGVNSDVRGPSSQSGQFEPENLNPNVLEALQKMRETCRREAQSGEHTVHTANEKIGVPTARRLLASALIVTVCTISAGAVGATIELNRLAPKVAQGSLFAELSAQQQSFWAAFAPGDAPVQTAFPGIQVPLPPPDPALKVVEEYKAQTLAGSFSLWTRVWALGGFLISALGAGLFLSKFPGQKTQ